MAKNRPGKPPGSGLELDKIELPGRSSPGIERKSISDPSENSASSLETDSSKKRQIRLIFTAVVSTLALLIALAIFLKRQDLDVSLMSLKETGISDSYLQVGPISATMGDNEIVRLSLNIGCENDAVMKKLAGKESIIRDKIVSVLTAPDTEPLLEQHQYGAVRTKIKESLKEIYGDSIGEVYIDELLTY